MIPRSLAVMLFATVLMAQDGARGMELFGLSRQDLRWRLITVTPQPGTDFRQTQDPRFRQLLAAGLAYTRVSPAAMRLQAAPKNLQDPEPRWLLLDPGGKVQGHGGGPWEVGILEETIREAQGRLPWDQLDRTLKDHPDHGEARLARLEWALALTGLGEGLAWRPDFGPPSGYQGVADAWAEFCKVPGWPWQVDLARPRLGRRLFSALGKEACLALARDLTTALATDPANPLLQANLAVVHSQFSISENVDAVAEAWEAIEPLPGQPWPPLPLIWAHLDQLLYLKRLSEARHKAQSWSRTTDPLFLDRASWIGHVRREAWLTTYSCIAETTLEGTQGSILESLDRIRDRAGAAHPEQGKYYLSRIRLPEDPQFRKKVMELVARPGLPNPPMPEPLPPWRVSIADRAGLPKLRNAFKEDPGFALWLPGEWQLATEPAQPRPLEAWLGKELVFSPATFPTKSQLAEALEQGRKGRLRTAMEHLAQAPEQPGRRRFRIRYLLERMPSKPLEHLLAEDFRVAGTYENLGAFSIDPNLWWAEAQRAVPELEEALVRWPLDAERWGALAFWSGFLPNHSGPGALADSQPSWQPRLPFRLVLPPSAHLRVGEQLVRQRAWTQVRAWFEPTWDAIRVLKPEDFKRWAWLQATAATAQSCLDQAYASLGQDGLRRGLKETWNSLQTATQATKD